MTDLHLLLLYSLLIIAASLLGGWLPSIVRMTHTRIQLIMSFVAGLMLGIAFYHLLPHVFFTLGGNDFIDDAMWWLMLGLLTMFLLLRAFHFHQHEPIVDNDSISKSCDEKHHHHHDVKNCANNFSWMGLFIGLGLHTVIDGIALGAAIKAESGGEVLLAGVGVFIAIILHKPLDAMSITALMQGAGWSKKSRLMVSATFSIICPLGAVVFFLGVDHLIDDQALWVGSALAFSAGVFICIALNDLLPEIQFHSHDQAKLTCALLLGVALAYGIDFIEPGHGVHQLETNSEEHHHHGH